VTTPDGRTPDAPDVDQPGGGAHAGDADDGRTPAAADQAEGDDPQEQ
jgi:hypothetical protein